MKLVFLSLLIFFTLVLVSHSQKSSDDKDRYKKEIIKADMDMSELATKEGFYTALSQYAADEFVKLDDGSYPVIGKNSFDEKVNGKPGPKTITWEPVKADASEAGDLGYTWGYWKFVLPDTIIHGNYFTVWKKQSDGTWKMALDGGNSTPGPAK